MAKAYTSSKRRLVDQIKATTQLNWASDMQQEAFEYGPYPLCLSGGYGSAKTWVATTKILFLADLFPGSRWVIGRRRWTELSKTTMQTFFKNCPPQAYQPYGRRSDTDKILTLNNGSSIYWMHFDDPEVATIIQGIELNGFFIDQAEEVEEEIFEKLTSRLGRWDKVQMPMDIVHAHPNWIWRNQTVDGKLGDPIVPPFAILACNPDNELHWIYKRFHEDSPDKYLPQGIDIETGEEIPSYFDQGYHMIHMPSDSNRYLSKVSLDALKNKDETYQRRYRRGEWGIPEGQIHEIRRESRIPGDREFIEKLLRSSHVYMTMDYGESAPTAVTWFMVDKLQNMYAWQEYYLSSPSLEVHRRNISAMCTYTATDDSKIFFEIMRSLADPTIFDKRAGKGGEKWTVAEEYADSNLYDAPPIWWEPADNNEMATRMRINEMLMVDPKRKHPYTGELGAPQLYFIEKSPEWKWGCDQVIRQTGSQRRVKQGMVMGKAVFTDDRDSKITDHAYDTVRYFAATRVGSPKEAKQILHPRSFSAIQKSIKSQKRQEAAVRIGGRSRFMRKFTRSVS